MDDWQNAKSTKFDVCAKLVSHLLKHDDAPEIEVHDGKVSFPKIPRESRKHPKQDTKILIYQEFPSLGPLLRNVSIPIIFVDARTYILLGPRPLRYHIRLYQWQYFIS